jgi:hypothetical protein
MWSRNCLRFLSTYFSGARVVQSLVFCVMFYISFFVLLFFFFCHCVVCSSSIYASDYLPFGIFTLFLQQNIKYYSRSIVHTYLYPPYLGIFSYVLMWMLCLVYLLYNIYKNKEKISFLVGLWCLVPLSTIFQLYYGG